MVVVITGATRGIGRAIAETLAEEGYDLALCARTARHLEDFRAELLQDHPDAEIFIQDLDLTDRAALSLFAANVLSAFDRIDVLINNAGVYVPGKILDETPENYDLVLSTNLHSAYFLTKALLPTMIQAQSGHIINMCSVASIQAYPNGGSYAIAKHALHGFGKTLREEVRRDGIRVTNILPGATWTDSWAGVGLPEDRLMHVRNIAEVVSAAIRLDSNAVLEDVVIRPIQGDLP